MRSPKSFAALAASLLPRLSILSIVGVGVSLPALAQTALDVSVNGTSESTGSYSANMFLNTCNGTQTSAAGDPAQLELQWTVPSNIGAVQLFGDTSNSCNASGVVDVPDSGIAAGDGTETSITPEACAGETSCGVGVGNVSINLRQVMTQAFAQALYPGVTFTGGDGGPCAPAEAAPPFYICVVETVNDTGALGTSQESTTWYMTVNFDSQVPPAPTDLTLAIGDQNLTLGWTYTSSALPADHTLVYFRPDPTPGLQASGSGTCAVGDGGAVGVDGGSTVETIGAGDAGADLAGWQTASFPTPATSGQINGLTNGVCYDLVVQTILADGTAGQLSQQITNAPVENYDFWRLYQAAGGQSQGGGCQQGGGVGCLLVLLLAVMGVRRRRSTP